MRKVVYVVPVALLLALAAITTASAVTADVLVSVGSPTTPFSQNKQNEPAMAVDANHPNILVAGANDEIDEEACNAGADNSCPFTPGIGVSGVYFSFDSGATWTQPTYTGLTARGCLGVVGNTDPPCTPASGSIGTLPWYFEAGLVSDGDPALAFGPKPDSSGHFSWANGSRLYYANLTANLFNTKRDESFKGFEAIYVSRTDNVTAAAAGGAAGKNAWMHPVPVSHQSSTTFSDKEEIWADNAATSPFFGNVYICWAAFMGQEKSFNAAPAGLKVAVSHDGGATWSERQISPAANNGQRNPMDGCTVRTDSHGVVYVFGIGTLPQAKEPFEFVVKSFDGGASWTAQQAVVGPVHQPGAFDPVQGRPVLDGIAGARSDLAPAPSVDIANGAPTGTGATNHMVMTYVSGTAGDPATAKVFFTESSNGGSTWSAPRAIQTAGDRGYYTAPAISPNGTDVYVVYNAFTTPFRNDTSSVRSLVGVVLHADVSGATTGAFSELHRGASGDPRGSSANSLTAEFLGDYVYAVATRTYGAAVWNDARRAADCPAVDAWRASLQAGTPGTKPAPEQQCPAAFGNSDIFGGSFADPTP